MYYPRNPSFVRCKEEISADSWKDFLISLNKYLTFKLSQSFLIPQQHKVVNQSINSIKTLSQFSGK